MRHKALPAVLLDVFRNRLKAQIVGRRALDWRVLEAADAVQLRFGKPIEQVLEVLFGFAREADDKGRADGQLGADLAPFLDACERLVFKRRALHGLEHGRTGVLEGDIQVRQDFAFGHQRDQFVHVRIGVDVVQTDPHAQLAQRLAHFGHARLYRTAVPEAGAVLDVDAVGAGVLGNDQYFLHASLGQALGFAQHVTDRAADQLAAHGRNDAEAAAVVAAFGNLQVSVVARRELDALRRHQIDQRVVVLLRRDDFVYCVNHLLVLLRTGHGQHAWVYVTDRAFFNAHAAGDDDAAVLCDGFANGVQRFSLGGIDKTAGIDHHHVSVFVGGYHLITFGAQLSQDALGIDQCLRAAE